MVFVTDVSLATNATDPSFAQVSNIDSAGYYYYSSTANKWIKLTPNVPVQDLRMLTNNNHVTQDAGVGSNGTSLGTGTDNIAIGKDGQKSITSGTRNISIGTNVLSSNTTGNGAIGIGYNALSKVIATYGTTAPIAIGESALQNLTSGDSMLAIGNNALSTITNGGNYSIAIGNSALAANNNSWNTAVGVNSLQSATGSNNSAFGYRTGNSMTTGVNNTYIGASTAVFLKSSVDHNQNTFVGSQITQNTSGTTPGFDVKYDGVSALGATSLQKLPTTLNAISQSSFLGTNATVAPSYTETSLNFGTAIGAQAKVGASNSIVLGRLPNSTLDTNGIPTTNPQDNVGIGVIAPTNALHVKTTAPADPVRIEGLQAESATTNNVLVVDGTGVIKTASRSSMSGGATVTASNGLNKSTNDIQLGGPLSKATTIAQGANSLAFTSTVTNAFSVDGSTLSVDAANHRVGIGTTTPAQKLHVSSGNVQINDINTNIGASGIDRQVVADANGVLKTINFGNYTVFHAQLKATQPIPANTITTLLYNTPVTNSGLYSYNTDTGILTFNEAGNYLITMQAGFGNLLEKSQMVLGIRTITTDVYLGRGSHYNAVATGPAVGELMSYTTMLQVLKGQQIKFTAVVNVGSNNTVLKDESGGTGSGNVTNVTIQKI